MRNDVLETIRDTFEETKNINIQYLLVQQEGDNEVVYGLYTNHVADSISFLHLPENSMETEIDNIKIFMLELGTVLRYIYYHGALNFLYLFHHDSTLITPSDNFLELSEYVMKNVKFDGNMRGSKEYRQILAKVFINRAISEITGGSYGN